MPHSEKVEMNKILKEMGGSESKVRDIFYHLRAVQFSTTEELKGRKLGVSIVKERNKKWVTLTVKQKGEWCITPLYFNPKWIPELVRQLQKAVEFLKQESSVD